MTDPMLTLIAVPYIRCASTAETVRRDRELNPGRHTVCCKLPAPPETTCWFCGDIATNPYRLGGHSFCCRACAGDYAE